MAKALQTIAKCCHWLGYATLLSVFGGGIAVLTAGFWLVPAQETPHPADVIVVLAGGFERSLYAADLYRQGLAPKVWISSPARDGAARQLEEIGIVLPSEEDIHRRILVQKKVASPDIDFFGAGSLSTAEEAHALRNKLSTKPLRLLVVTSPTHARRARIVLSDALTAQGSAVQVVATPYEHFEAYWWRDQGSARSVILELTKLVFYYCGGRFMRASNSSS